MDGHSELELLITVVVGAQDEASTRAACADLLRRVGGEVVSVADCSDEEPGCWSLTMSRGTGESGWHVASLSRVVRNFLRELGPGHARYRVACAPPTAWAVVDDPELIGELVPAGERLLVEAWSEEAERAPLHQESTVDD
ncbi:hypothetical protein EIL87_15100 [Saccharopolyspora rhizosphaerae]|uniref:Uncharacterized protein n=1 Tax=Saccharopolyspora rhizosphaerae TaxID=2492662 RepID=A0A426JQC5_9PSEU|nr:hypothetical protein [Saccharopolyspora rhizosphaerae]RRO15392.1 hypothetical protein EIL87_15100 [Saccharopolyspora rhizosphaerae]